MGFTTLPPRTGETIGWRVEDRLTDDEVEAMHQQLDTVIATNGSARLLVDLTTMQGVEPSAVWEDLRRSLGKLDAIERMAVIGDATWQQVLTNASGALTRTDARHYPPEDREAAWEWLQR